MDRSAFIKELANAMGVAIPKTNKQADYLIKLAKGTTKKLNITKSASDMLYNRESEDVDGADMPIVEEESSEEFSENGYEPTPADISCEYTQKLYPIGMLLNLLDQDKLRLPAFQRKFVWNRKKRQSFLNSIIVGIPTPNIMFARAIDLEADGKADKYIIDGFQRLSTIRMFKNGKQKLGPYISTYAGKKFDQLPEMIKDKFLDTAITVIEVQTKRDNWPYIFRQINQGGISLNAMEIRRATYEELPCMVAIDQFAENHQLWIDLFGGNTRYRGLAALLRALAIHHQWENFRTPMSQFLDKACRQLYSWDSETTRDHLDIIITAIQQHIGKSGFRTSDGKPLNMGWVDVMIHMGLLILDKDEDIDHKKLAGYLQRAKNEITADKEIMPFFNFDTSSREAVCGRMRKSSDVIAAIIEENKIGSR